MFNRIFGRDGAPVGPLEEVDVVAARTLQQQGAPLIDMREPTEFAAGYPRGAHNIPLGQLSSRLGDIGTDRTVLLICRSGNRSRAAQQILRRHGITDTRNVRGDMSAWQAAGLPVR